MPDVHIPVIGNVPRGGVIIGGIAGAGVLGYVWYKKKTAAAAATNAYGYGGYAYGYGTNVPAGYYGYGYGYGTGPMGGGITPYPIGSEYGYGAYGYGYYNPYTGQYMGGGTGTTAIPSPPSWWTSPPSWWKPPAPGGGSGQKPTHTITANGHENLAQIAGANKVSRIEILVWNPHLAPYMNSKKPIRRGTRVKV